MQRCTHYMVAIQLLCASAAIGQNTVGLLSYEPTSAQDGYNLLYPHNQPNVYLLDNCGQVVHMWEDSADFRPGNTAYLRADGTLVKAKRSADFGNDPIWAPGGGAIVEIRSWENDLLWQFELNDSNARLHHDIEPLPNGNILMIAWERKTAQEAIDAGRDPATLDTDELWPDYVLEVDPTLDSIVWEWHVWDHLVQDFDSTKANFGEVAAASGRLDINAFLDGRADWIHANAIDYHATLDQILLSVPHLNEIWIIDHSTTSAQAATEIGGQAGLGGNFLYRWGNPATYKAGVPEDQLLFFNHDAHWVDDFLDPTNPDFGKIIVFNNRVGIDFSAVNIVVPPWDMYAWSYTKTGQVWGPFNYDRTINHPTPSALFSTGLSSAQVLKNGNVLICSGRQGYSFEITPQNEIVWEYKTPLRRGLPVAQGDSLTTNDNLTFRMTRYPLDHAAFDGRDLSPKGWIETAPDSTLCDVLLPADQLSAMDALTLYPNPAISTFQLRWEHRAPVPVEVYNSLGHPVWSAPAVWSGHHIDVSSWGKGSYWIRVDRRRVLKLIVVD